MNRKIIVAIFCLVFALSAASAYAALTLGSASISSDGSGRLLRLGK